MAGLRQQGGGTGGDGEVGWCRRVDQIAGGSDDGGIGHADGLKGSACHCAIAVSPRLWRAVPASTSGLADRASDVVDDVASGVGSRLGDDVNVVPTAPTIVSLQDQITTAFGDIFDVSELLADARTQLDAQGAEIAAARAGEANLSARIAGVNQARIDGDEANALAISGVAARTANTEADIIDLENALANETTARAEAVQQVTARQRAAPNLLPSIRAWPFFGGAWVDDNYPTLGDYTFSTAPGSFRYFDVAIEAGAPFVVSIEGASGNGSRVQVEYHGASGYIADSGIDLRAFTWGQRVEATFAAPVGLGITKARVLLQNFTTASWARAMLQPGSISTSYREDAAVSSLGAMVTEQSLAIIDLENQQAIASWRIKSEASGSKPAIIEAVSALGGSHVAFGAEQIYFGGNTVFDDATDTWQTVEGSTVYVRADGAPFGANADLREWWGPVGIALGAMTTANGYSGRMTTAPYNFDNTSGVGFHVKSSHMYISASRTGPGSVGTANVTVEAVGAVGPVDFIVYRMSGDASIEAFPVRSTASTAPYRHILSFDTNLTNQTKRAVFGCSARDAAGNTGNVVIEVEIFYNEE